MAQKTFVDGDVLTASDLNTYCGGEGGAWTSWTPTVTQSGSVTVTNTRSRYARYGRLIIAQFDLDVTGSGTTSNDITVSVPVTAASSGFAVGAAWITDSGTTNYAGVWLLFSTTSFKMLIDQGNGYVGTSPAFALASGDNINGVVVYEAAS